MPHLTRLFLFGAVSAAAFAPLRAADLIKADNSTALNTAGSYTNGSATPTNADWVIFDGTFATTTATISGGGATVLGLRIINPGNDVTLNLGNSTFSVGVSGGTSGSIDLSSATKNLTVNSSGSFGAFRMYGSAPTITVGSGRTLTVNAPVFVFNTNGGSLNTSGAGTITLNGEVRNGDTGTRTTRVVHAGTGVLTLGGLNTYTGGTSVSVGTVAISQNFTMAGANAIGLNASSGTNGKITFGGGTLTFGGTLQLDLSGSFASGGTFDLINLGSGVSPGSFSAVSIAGSYTASLVNNGSGVWSGASGGTTFVFDQSTGDLTVSAIPEPSTVSLLIGGLGLGVALTLRRRHA